MFWIDIENEFLKFINYSFILELLKNEFSICFYFIETSN
ncbi:hypothetical protein LEP1GSC145_3140 [Leptospira interrogans serovar Djasiman str. LT1649]|uniref:Uncharacterized protein n=1 Tax=Leptospira interrogans str. 2006001854 TaxID=1001590 RepID=M6GCB2_LEPIR|nr:hypothetical protein LEP1GSC080_3251 [Leptospira interrogans str. FPW2026]EMM80194.1 hypothetical protein LEP1GSC037_5058 [Leptospira interrogans str. 2006001854]EMM91587.1 hypothetical protein LEP1GSC145_3140 [Leptospira interrogans serovar Djasiman str. LT1649]